MRQRFPIDSPATCVRLRKRNSRPACRRSRSRGALTRGTRLRCRKHGQVSDSVALNRQGEALSVLKGGLGSGSIQTRFDVQITPLNMLHLRLYEKGAYVPNSDLGRLQQSYLDYCTKHPERWKQLDLYRPLEAR